ncbi:MAG: LLM class flavin-dependent oxidoreductase [Chloroflexi bacterium]|nr:LLM class flavin-dependent oxidoreductase [Chloroflexota bacterium]
MKFHWFHLMPWPDLPDDFQQKHRSVWVDPDYSLYDPERGNTMYNEYLDELEFAETCGFDGLGVNEHHSNAYGMMPSPNLMAAALARRTNKAALLVMGNSIALYNPPVRVAEEMAMLDVMSGGRLIAGFPVGTSMDTNFTYGMTPATLRERYYEAHDMILQAWNNKGVSSFNGKFNQIRYMNPWPRPLQEPHPPIWIPGGGSIETWGWCADMGYLYSYLSYSGYLRARALMDLWWQEIDKRGLERNPFQAGFGQTVCVAETDAEAKKLYAKHIDYFYNRCLHVYPGFADAPGYRTNHTVKAGIKSQMQATAAMMKERQSWESLVENGYIIAGSPDTVSEKIEELATTLHLGQLMVLLHVGDMPRDLALYNTQMFAQKVMPRFKEKFEREYVDHWMPKPLPESRRAAPIPATLADLREAVAVGGGGAS